MNKAAFKLGTLVGAGALTENEVVETLYAAATDCGYVASDGQRATLATINSGLQAGIAHPREIPDADEGDTSDGIVAGWLAKRRQWAKRQHECRRRHLERRRHCKCRPCR